MSRVVPLALLLIRMKETQCLTFHLKMKRLRKPLGSPERTVPFYGGFQFQLLAVGI